MKTVHKCLMIAILLNAGLSHSQAGNNSIKNNRNKEVDMSVTQKNKEVVRKLYEESLNAKRLDLLSELVSGDYTGIRGAKGAAAFREPIEALIKAFPDIQWKIADLIGEADKVVVRWTWQGTHTGQFNQFAATGKTISNDGMAIYELKNGKIINTQVQTDRLGFLQGLEVLPADLGVQATKKDAVNFIDKFLVPAAAKTEFYERMRINRDFIKKLPGFIEDVAYEYTDANGDLVCVTVAQWGSREAIDKAKEAVQAEYKRQGFDMPAMIKRLNIVMERGIYRELRGH